MLKMILKTFLKVFIAVVVVRLGVLAVGAQFVAGNLPGVSGKNGAASLTEYRQMGQESLEAIGQLLNR